MSRTPIHPGEILADELEALEMTATELARAIRVPPNRITSILAGRRSVTADTALRLGRYFATSAELWMNLQKAYDLKIARAGMADTLESIPERPNPGVAPVY